MYLDRVSNYDKEPTIKITESSDESWTGYAAIIDEIKAKCAHLNKDKLIVTVETYPGVRKEELVRAFQALSPVLLVDADTVTVTDDEVLAKIQHHLTDDRVFGVMSHFTIDDFIDKQAIKDARHRIADIQTGVIFIYGVGASRIIQPDLFLYADLARWEIQMRYRSGELANWKADNADEDVLRKYKRGFFFEWRMADRLKKELFEKMDYLLDTNQKDKPNMITGSALLAGLEAVIRQPFRVVPYFDPGVWGGQWMKEVCDLNPEADNYAWSFDGVPEENSLYLQYGDVRIEIPAINVVFYRPVALLGRDVYARFGAEFPIRFNFLDTMGGGNLSLQVHPTTDYAYDKFGMAYTQEESYYILDAEDESYVYLGLKDGVDKYEMLADLRRAQKGDYSFPDEKYINKVPAKKHDHFLIPPGTIHCSGTGSMILEISASKYIFTFKLWDWDRLGLDGLPRPVHIDHGEAVIDWSLTPDVVDAQLVNAIEPLEVGEGLKSEKTGLHQSQFIQTYRHWFADEIQLETKGSVNVLNLVEGVEAIVESPTHAFDPFVVHYVETFIIPEQVGTYTIKPHGASVGKEITIIQARVRC